MSAINRITCNDGDFVGAFRQNVIRVIGSYGSEQEPDEYDDKIKAKQEEMVALIAENAKEGSYTNEFDERYRKIAEVVRMIEKYGDVVLEEMEGKETALGEERQKQ